MSENLEENVPPVEPAAPEAPPAPVAPEETSQLFSGTTEEEAPVEPTFIPVMRGKLDKFGIAMGTGRRKTSVARVRMKPGNGKIEINGRTLEDFFPTDKGQAAVVAPMKATETMGQYDLWVRVHGGGTSGQAGAITLGVARALQVLNPSLHPILSDHGFLTRDGRMVERKKYGHKKARRSFQFSKR